MPHLTPETLRTFAQILTPIIAVGAGVIAIWAILAQQAIARRRASIDFLIKTELDPQLLKAWDDFKASLDKLKQAGASRMMSDENYKADSRALETYLGIHEMIAIGINNKIFDENIFFEYWRYAMSSYIDKSDDFIREFRTKREAPRIFEHTIALNKRWKVKLDRLHAAIAGGGEAAGQDRSARGS
jgi:hypothetical protein